MLLTHKLRCACLEHGVAPDVAEVLADRMGGKSHAIVDEGREYKARASEDDIWSVE